MSDQTGNSSCWTNQESVHVGPTGISSRWSNQESTQVGPIRNQLKLDQSGISVIMDQSRTSSYWTNQELGHDGPIRNQVMMDQSQTSSYWTNQESDYVGSTRIPTMLDKPGISSSLNFKQCRLIQFTYSRLQQLRSFILTPIAGQNLSFEVNYFKLIVQ